MNNPLAQSKSAQEAYQLVRELQKEFVDALEKISKSSPSASKFSPISWVRDQGLHGGGTRYVSADSPLFNRASVNISQVHYDDLPQKKLASATALSTIIHPQNPHAPSVHMHISWTELKNEEGYWRIMADLNPSIVNPNHKKSFDEALEKSLGSQAKNAKEQGEGYFYIPALNRHRGVSHFYLEQFNSGHAKTDFELAKNTAKAVIGLYPSLVSEAVTSYPQISTADRQAQLAYHSLYLLQVLTLDRGTTSGLLVHNQNDVGILGSLPSHVDKPLLEKWLPQLPPAQQPLLNNLLAALSNTSPSPISQELKPQLCEIIRSFYRENPEALKLQASGHVLPPTVDNHKTQGAAHASS